jgi:hypothetical protein
VTYAMDLTPLITQTDLDIAAFIDAAIQSLAEDVRSRINLLDAKGN